MWPGLIVDIFLSVLDIFVPKIKIKDPTASGWIDAEVRHAQNKKNRTGGRLKNLI